MDALMLLAATGEPTTWEWLMSMTWTILSVAVGLGFVIFVHELGHFLVAKACGVKCEKFYIGFDIFNLRFCRFQWGETEYGIGALPLGGYVKMLGQDDDPRHAMAEAERCKVPAADSPDAARAAALAEGTAAEGFKPGATVEQPTYELDPRSYPAKPVLARMAIISAGVIMNVIFGVILGACAYKLGVSETPAIIGPTVPGTPAWTANLQPGMKITRLGSGSPYEYYRFEDVKHAVIFAGDDHDVPFTVRTPSGEEKEFSVRPSSRTVQKTRFPALGFEPPLSTKVAVHSEDAAHLAPQTSVPLKSGDRVVAVDGIVLNQTKYDPALHAHLARHAGDTIRLQIERPVDAAAVKGSPPPTETVAVTVSPKPMRGVGLEMRIGPVVAIRNGSPAQKAGFAVGDVIQKINGSDVGDPLTLRQRLIPASDGENWTFVVARKDAKGDLVTRELSVTPEMPRQFCESYFWGGPVAMESVGVAYEISNVVANVAPQSAAEKAGLAPGDKVTKVKFQASGPKEQEREERALGQSIHEEMVIDNNLYSWTRVHTLLQMVLPNTTVQFAVTRGDKTIDARLATSDVAGFYAESHGLEFEFLNVEHKAQGIGDAFYLGFREMKEQMGNVVQMISHLARGRISLTNLSGPPGILMAAGHFANEGLPKLLLFLTILSANLAVLNFLPIPVLDGGHMVFLAYEGVTKKPVNPNVQGYLSLAGLVLLLSLMVFASTMDFIR